MEATRAGRCACRETHRGLIYVAALFSKAVTKAGDQRGV